MRGVLAFGLLVMARPGLLKRRARSRGACSMQESSPLAGRSGHRPKPEPAGTPDRDDRTRRALPHPVAAARGLRRSRRIRRPSSRRADGRPRRRRQQPDARAAAPAAFPRDDRGRRRAADPRCHELRLDHDPGASGLQRAAHLPDVSGPLLPCSRSRERPRKRLSLDQRSLAGGEPLLRGRPGRDGSRHRDSLDHATRGLFAGSRHQDRRLRAGVWRRPRRNPQCGHALGEQRAPRKRVRVLQGRWPQVRAPRERSQRAAPLHNRLRGRGHARRPDPPGPALVLPWNRSDLRAPGLDDHAGPQCDERE